VLPYTFCHLKGVSKSAEERLWSLGIVSWNDFELYPGSVFSSKKTASIKGQLKESQAALERENIDFFLSRLTSAERVRIYPHVRGKIAYVDIETTGLNRKDEITTIALYDGKTLNTYVRGMNLDNFIRDIQAYTLIVTYNGLRFDLPFLRSTFQKPFKLAHLDLCPVMQALGYRGGLKRCELLMGIKRQVPEGIDGREAVSLWHRYKQDKDISALRQLLAYNSQDVLSLEILLVKAYNRVMEGCPVNCRLPLPNQCRLSWH